MKFVSIIARWTFILSLPVLLLTASIAWTVNSQWLYEYGFEKYSVGQTTGLAQSELEKTTDGLISYFNSGEEYISLEVIKDGQPFRLFNQREIEHLRDVKGLIRLDYWVLLGTSVYSLAYAGVSLFWQSRKHWRQLAWGIVSGSGLTLTLMLALGLGTLLDFDQLFLQFHLFSFANELWQLNPTRDYMIMLFPGGFWYDAFLLWAGSTAALAVILGGATGGHLWARRRKTAA